ncbi:MAG: hypothetical protein CMO20_04310 [Thermoplasmata archaeon]|nr:hypothetical protein [Thermoplasmata archaeon]|tara:strand:+ start:254 stop:652 length:399 start_codon:yes stop_codon:yes gene_type:complete
MALSRRARLFVIGLFITAALTLVLAGNEPDVQYSVDEIMVSPSQFEGDDVHLRGSVVVDSYDSYNFTFSLHGTYQNLTIDASGTPLPPSFEEGRVVAIKGELIKNNNEWKVIAEEIITGCPSKYDAAEENQT